MSPMQAIVLGIVEGLTEYLPVSSTGHLILAQRAMGIPDSEAAEAYAIVIQAGAILAVLGLYMGRVKQAMRGLVGRDKAGLNLAKNITVAFVPAAVIGLLLNKIIKEYLFGGDRWGLWPTIAAWGLGGAAILAVAWSRKKKEPTEGFGVDELVAWQALVIGLMQCIAMWPGVSRSLVTIVGGVLVGMSLPAAVEFSFLLGVVMLGAATAYDGHKHGHAMLEHYGAVSLIIGLVAALVSAVIAVKWMVSYLKQHGLAVFGYYRVALAMAVAWLVIAKVI
ncbi:MAG: undecaprenyl-diphosphate phosphatase [Planctomycetes bacterium]|nr:undecaprenyl-diphosphate phosphatase [Planctomycetota bacterium]